MTTFDGGVNVEAQVNHREVSKNETFKSDGDCNGESGWSWEGYLYGSGRRGGQRRDRRQQ
jgi:hypothetical protein